MSTKANLKIDQGTDYSTVITLTDTDDDPIDLTNFIGRGQIRKHYESANAVNFVVSVVSSGDVQISLSAAASNAMKPGRYVYDIELEDQQTGLVSRVAEGLVTITPSVTRDD